MSIQIEKEKVRELVADGAVLVDVLSANAYAKTHLAGATNIPLTGLSGESAANLQPDHRIIVYCNDYQ